ncbi:hypothetical protein P0082_12360 [Candidatus Haliotispira prima]|uniref:Lipopolysaccharide assembly protein A domain-containing protein n=1 Tax=Candidatus Haliotispira prima TaxID=3034016 RepID=A0ABY8MKB8_9SPIO|nr:hypothetical protein P0082_12360 [Candidatus Haliotispira prima]
MERIKSVLRLIGILLIPSAILVLSAAIWQNDDVIIQKFSLIGGWWEPEKLKLSSLLTWFLLSGAVLVLIFVLLFNNERKLYRELAELRRMKKENNVAANAKNEETEQPEQRKKTESRRTGKHDRKTE